MNDPIKLEDRKIQLSHDGKVKIATGKSRKDTAWKNKEVSWSNLLSKLSNTYYTRETIEEYAKASKTKQDEIKDIGGFVGGSLKEGRRKAENVLTRSLLTLDADFAPTDLWDNIEMLYDFSIACYSTHKHTPSKPRLRLVIPLSRSVTPEEYEAIGRKIAEDLGIDYFDDTTYQASRLMYWPSTSKNGEYFFRFIDAKWLDADAVLNRYEDWRDTSFWPESSRVQKAHKKLADRQGDPLEKDGLIGAFCRAYTIQEAIEEFLSEEYVECVMKDRYTYTQGSTSAGLVIYEDKFAYSNHATDPCSGLLCNAFDLVRLHKYGELDRDKEEGTEVTKLPSFTAMQEFASKDKRVKKELIQGTKDDFDDDLDIDDDNEDWMQYLDVTKQGKILNSISNVRLILDHDKRIKKTFGFNDLSHRPELITDLPWRNKGYNPVWKDSDDSGLREWLEAEYGLSGKEKIMDAFTNVAVKNHYHPIRTYLDSLIWDGVERLEVLLIEFLGADDTPYVRAVTRKQFVAAVARIFEPGVKHDEMLIIVGDQGIGKSTLLDLMGGKWFSDSVEDFKGKDVAEGLQGRWIIEIGELDAMKRNEVETVKKFLSKRTDIFRFAYGRRSDEYPRQCVFFGTTNTDDFLKDQTGGRRFWPVDTCKARAKKSVFKDLSKEVIDQLWAEAKHYYEQGETLHVEGEIAEAAAEAQRAHKEIDPRIGQVIEYLDMKLPTSWSEMTLQARREYIHNSQFGDPEEFVIRDRVCPIEIWQELFKGDVTERSRYDIKMITQMMKEVPGWESEGKPKHFGKLYGTQRGFRRETDL
ncbi:VapE domain-containing protein [Cellulosilyticum sp. WCF-2]|uniref:VapE domain-containing protein n=1 Tax=Cellulosilyticum sp. WCF-2 TaxID=2497860 RepID=UPI000F8D4F0C|nr:VapE domain-containing protein [Cellulosilyticum sp. WCF-2]QEH69742.1 hypothetical protein EKH84_15610 [Cellulosilyticum sp. WCF-2]